MFHSALISRYNTNIMLYLNFNIINLIWKAELTTPKKKRIKRFEKALQTYALHFSLFVLGSET